MVIVAVVAITVLIGAWVLALRAQLRRRRGSGADWSGTDGRPHLWTSQARCLSCGSGDGLVDDSGGQVSFLCLRCGGRRVRGTRG